MAARTARPGAPADSPGGIPADPPGGTPGVTPAGSPTGSPARSGARTEPKPSPLPLTERQEARRRGILAASTQLACGGGFDAVQMREVAETSGVALGTLYRYFPSKVHLLVATMEDQLRLLHLALRQRPPAVTAPSERVAETLLRAFRALQREPLLADAMVRALIFADRSVSAEVATVSRLTRTIIVDAMGLGAEAGARADADAGAGAGASGAPGPHGPAEADPGAGPSGAQLSAVRVIEHTWHAALVTWLSGRETVAQVTEDIRTVCGLLDHCGPGEAGGGGSAER